MIGTSDQSCWLAEACKILFLLLLLQIFFFFCCLTGPYVRLSGRPGVGQHQHVESQYASVW